MTASPGTLHQLLENASRLWPDRVAVEDPEREKAVAYRDLNALSDQLRDGLVRGGVGPGDRVGICLPKSIAALVSVFGALKAGAAYVPVDVNSPAQRNASIFQDCSVRAIIAQASSAEGLRAAFGGEARPASERVEALGDLGPDAVLLTAPAESGRNSALVGDPASPGSLAYILYTSGSTGKPKGVVHTHSSALSFVDWCSETFGPSERDRFSAHAPLHFDLSILDIYVAIKHGATLILIGEDLGKQPIRLAPIIAERRISVWYSTPSILRLLAEYGRMARYDYPALRTVLFAGEVFPVKHLRALKSLWPKPKYFNLYGPTETNVCTFYEVPTEIPQDRTAPFPIGKTCSNDRAKVMGDDIEVRSGEEGELYVSGGSVMEGYWNLPERTAEAFYRDDSGTRWYRTGDVVREDVDGTYVFLGRRDRMVKRRGYRVELGEIEAALHRLPEVTEAAAVALPDEENGVLIKAFLSCPSGARPSLIALKQYCAENLPLYIIPDRFSFQPSLPKTSTDKIDYQRLKELD